MNPTSLAMIGAAVVAGFLAGTAGWFARGLVVDHIQIPAIIEQQSALCEAATEKAAADAVAAEQLRQIRIGEKATQQFIEESQAAADDAQARQDLLEMEIANYEHRLKAAGGSVCLLDRPALELIGVRPDQPDFAGGR